MLKHALIALLATAALRPARGACDMPDGVPPNPPDVDNTGFATRHGKLRLDGVQLVDEAGEPVQLMGMSSHGLHWFPSCYSKASIEYLVEHWGINVFRAAMYVGEGGYADGSPGVNTTVYDVVRWTEELGIYVIIDWHVLTPGDPNDAMYHDAMLGATRFFEEAARNFVGKKHVLYETANEPNGVSWAQVKGYHDALIPKIRAIDAETIILAGTPTWSQDIHDAAADPVSQPHHVMYAFHFYAGTHEFLLPRLQEYASQIPIFVTEWGTSTADGNGGVHMDTALRFLDVMEDADGAYGQRISFAQWSYADKAESSAALLPGACAAQDWDAVSCSGSFLRSYIKSRQARLPAGPPSPPSPPPSPPAPHRPPASPSPPPSECDLALSFGVSNSWAGGFNGYVSVTPWVPGAVIEVDWSSSGIALSSVWNGDIVSTSGSVVTIRLAAYVAQRVGFTAQGTVPDEPLPLLSCGASVGDDDDDDGVDPCVGPAGSRALSEASDSAMATGAYVGVAIGASIVGTLLGYSGGMKVLPTRMG